MCARVQGKEIVGALTAAKKPLTVAALRAALAGRPSADDMAAALDQLTKDERVRVDRRGPTPDTAVVTLLAALEM